METSYLLYIRAHRCTRCQNSWQTSDLYRSEIISGNRIMTPTEIVTECSPFGISRLQPKTHHVCFSCAGGLEIQRTAELAADAERRWQETLKRKSEMPLTKPSKTSSIPSLDDL